MFSIGWRRYLVHYKRRFRYGMRDAFITILIYASLFSLCDHVGTFIMGAAAQGTVVHDTGAWFAALALVILAVSLMFTAIDAWMITSAEQRQFRAKMGFEE